MTPSPNTADAADAANASPGPERHLDPALAARLSRVALGHVTREYPNKLEHVMASAEDCRTPRELHPVFYGSYDWHSCVHGYWLLARLLRRYPDHPASAEAIAVMDAHLTPDKVAGEVAYLARPQSTTFERPYGWAWLLALATECDLGAVSAAPEGLANRPKTADRMQAWSEALRPLAQAFAARFAAFLPKSTYPLRVGTHFNTAFALKWALRYARHGQDAALATLIVKTANGWYAGDRDCPAWEPGGDEFLSPALMEASLMQDVLAGPEFIAWLMRFLPHLAAGTPAVLLQPATVTDRSDGKLAHLDGLNLSRAWCQRALADTLDAVASGALDVPNDQRDYARKSVVLLRDAAARHFAAGFEHVSGDYMGEHWLATFALLAMDRTGADA